MFILIAIIVLAILVSTSTKKRKRLFACHSSSCLHNTGKDCKLPMVCIYDNVVNGICLYHSEEVHRRLQEVLPKLSKEEVKMLEDIKAVKDVEAFKDFMKKHGV